MDLELKRRRVLVTGSTRGIGLAIARAFAAEGADVWLSGRDLGVLELARKRVTRVGERVGGGEAQATGCDLVSGEGRERLVGEVTAGWGRLDVLVLNLGAGKSVGGAEVPLGEWQRVLELNLLSGMETLRVMLPLLRKGRGANVVMVGSIAGREVLGAPMAYGAAKAALTHAMKASSRWLAKEGIRVNMAVPGNIFFKGGTWDRKLKEDSVAVSKMLETSVPLGRLGKPEEVADVVVFLASGRAGFITGTSVVVDGGQTVFPG